MRMQSSACHALKGGGGARSVQSAYCPEHGKSARQHKKYMRWRSMEIITRHPIINYHHMQWGKQTGFHKLLHTPQFLDNLLSMSMGIIGTSHELDLVFVAGNGSAIRSTHMLSRQLFATFFKWSFKVLKKATTRKSQMQITEFTFTQILNKLS